MILYRNALCWAAAIVGVALASIFELIDEASARYAEFGPFYTSYVVTPAEMLEHCRIGAALDM